jgi:hypothetical protein
MENSSSRDLNERLERLENKYSENPSRARRAMSLASRLLKIKESELRDHIYLNSNDGDISNGLAQSLLYMKGENIYVFTGNMAGAYITSNSSQIIFKGPSAGKGVKFEGDYTGLRVNFNGEGAGAFTKFKGEGAGTFTKFKGEGAGKGAKFEGKYAGLIVKFGKGAGKGAKFKGEQAGLYTIFEEEEEGKGSSLKAN